MASGAQPSPNRRRTLSSTIVQESVAAATAIVDKWRPDAARCSLFLDYPDGDAEAGRFLRAAAGLHRAMLLHASDAAGLGDSLVQAQALLQTAMLRLQLELQLLQSSLYPNTIGAIADHDVQGTSSVVAATSHIRYTL